MHVCYRIQHGAVETGSTYNSGCEQYRDAIPAAIGLPNVFEDAQDNGTLTDDEMYTRGRLPNLAWGRLNGSTYVAMLNLVPRVHISVSVNVPFFWASSNT